MKQGARLAHCFRETRTLSWDRPFNIYVCVCRAQCWTRMTCSECALSAPQQYSSSATSSRLTPVSNYKGRVRRDFCDISFLVNSFVLLVDQGSRSVLNYDESRSGRTKNIRIRPDPDPQNWVKDRTNYIYQVYLVYMDIVQIFIVSPRHRRMFRIQKN